MKRLFSWQVWGGPSSRSPPPSPYQLFSVEARAQSLCAKARLSIDCDRVGRREAGSGWYLCGDGKVHRGESAGVCFVGVKVVIPC